MTNSCHLCVRFGGISSQGRKAENQDAFIAHQPSRHVAMHKGAIAILADGVSSSAYAREASQTSVTLFAEDYYATPDSWSVKVSVVRVLTSLNNWLFHHSVQRPEGAGSMMTTLSAVILKSRTAHIFHIGDSRIFRYRNGELEQLTQDHSLQQSPQQSFLTRALGMDSRLEVDYQSIELDIEDRLLLTTDGIHDFVPSKDIVACLSSIDDAETCAQVLQDKAASNNSDDNTSCLIVDIVSLPDKSLQDVHKQLSQLAIPPVLSEGQKLEGYTVERVLYSGTRSHLYLVSDQTNQLKVLKAPSDYFSDDPQYLEGFIRESWIGQQINHPNVMKVYPKPDSSPFFYHLCEYIEGGTLRQWMLDHPNPTLQEVRGICKLIIRALRALQRKGMTHRDLKPENILITHSGQIKLIDFGTVLADGLQEINTPVTEETPVGSIQYIAPEYLQGDSGTHRSDMFSLAIIIYEMLSGHLPFGQLNSAASLSVKHHDWQYQSLRQYRPDIPVWVDIALKRGCNPVPSGRYEALSEMEKDLTTPHNSTLSHARNAPLLERHPVRSWQIISLSLALLCIGLIVKDLL